MRVGCQSVREVISRDERLNLAPACFQTRCLIRIRHMAQNIVIHRAKNDHRWVKIWTSRINIWPSRLPDTVT
eukprot:1271727-Karenia_brevis.AAC.1